jgi:hypothetical protein
VLSNEEFDLIDGCIDNEGFDYTFAHYSDFGQIEDINFHTLRLKYLAARDALAEYIGIQD